MIMVDIPLLSSVKFPLTQPEKVLWDVSEHWKPYIKLCLDKNNYRHILPERDH